MKIRTGCGTLYVTINEMDGRAIDLFGTLGKSGGCESAMMQVMGRMVSLALRLGGDLDAVIHQLENVKCPRPRGFGPRRVCSCADGMAQALKKVDREE